MMIHMEYIPHKDEAEITRLCELLGGESGPVAAVLQEILGSFSEGKGLALTWLDEQIDASIVAGLLGVSLEFVRKHASEMGLIAGSDRSIMSMRFDRDSVLRFREESRARQMQAIRSLTRISEEAGYE